MYGRQNKIKCELRSNDFNENILYSYTSNKYIVALKVLHCRWFIKELNTHYLE